MLNVVIMLLHYSVHFVLTSTSLLFIAAHL